MTAPATVKMEKLMACMTCPLCNYLFTDATTISECLHTFCRNCIYEKITGDDLDCCPVCNINLGCVPLDKLRADHNVEELREKIFPCKRKKVKEAETARSVSAPLPAKRKQRLLSSLVSKQLNNTPSTSADPTNSLTAQQCPPQSEDNNTQVLERENDISDQRIIQIVEEARSNHCNVQDTAAKSSPLNTHNKDGLENGFPSVQQGKLPDTYSRRRFVGNGRACVPKDDIDRCRTVSNPIWFSLVASDNQEGDEPLPQISSSYLRVRDGSLPVSFIQKYLMKKLSLASETEVEISLKGKAVSSTSLLQEVVELWQKTATKVERIQTSVGSSARDFVMVLSYGRKAPARPKEHFTNVCTNL